MTKHTVATVNELAEGQCKLVRLNGVEIGVLLIDGAYHAYRNFCPHAGAPLFAAQAGRAAYEPGSEKWSVRCPWHGWEFDLRNGEFLRNRRCTLDLHRVEIDGGMVCVWA